jgi:hypothetical protein
VLPLAILLADGGRLENTRRLECICKEGRCQNERAAGARGLVGPGGSEQVILLFGVRCEDARRPGSGRGILSRSIKTSVPFPYALSKMASLSISVSERPGRLLVAFRSCSTLRQALILGKDKLGGK